MANAEKRFDIVIATKHQLAKQGLDIVNGGLVELGKDARAAQSALAGITEFQRLKKDTVAAESAWKEATAEVARLAAALKQTDEPTRAQQREFDKAKIAAGKLKDEYQKNQTQLEQLRRKLGEAGVSTTDLSAAVSRLKGDLAQSGNTAKTFGADLAAASRSLDVRPMALVRQEVDKLRADYKALASSGTLSQKELAQAATSLKEKIAAARGETTKMEAAQKGLGFSSSTLVGHVKGLVAAYVGFQAIGGLYRTVTGAAREAETAQYTLKASVEAANREFDNTGTLEGWQQKVKDLSGELRIFSETEVAGAVSRTVDMTKRLGLSADQMEELIRRTADLSAGKTDLEGGIERVTAALRGEAEASEYLGLTLNETYVRAWHEANNATGKAWKDLTDLEKAQVRYNVLLEQSSAMQGRAADSARTFDGALALVKAQVTNAIANNENLGDAMARVASIVSDNADEIAELAAVLTSAVGSIVTFTIENGKLLAGLVGAGGLVLTLGKFAGAVTSVKTAVEGVAGVKVPAILGQGGGINAALVSRIGLYGTLAVAIGETVSAYASMREAQSEAEEAERRAANSAAYAQGIADAASASTGQRIETIQELNRLLREGSVVQDKVTGQFLTAAQAQEKATEAARRAQELEERRAETFQKLKERTAELAAQYGELDVAAVTAADRQRILDAAVTDLISPLEDARQRAAAAGDAYYDAAIALDTLIEGTDEYNQALEKSKAAQEDYLAALDALRRAEWEAALQQYDNEEAELQLSLDRRLQQIQALYDQDVYSRRNAIVQKLTAERDFVAAVLKLRQAEVEKLKALQMEGTQDYIEAVRAVQYAELDLKDITDQVTAAMIDLAKASSRAGDAGEDAGHRGRRGMDDWADGARRTREETERLISAQKKARHELAEGFYGQWDEISKNINAIDDLDALQQWSQKEGLFTKVQGNPFFASLQRHAQDVYRERFNELAEATRQGTSGASASDQGGGKTMTLKFQGPNGQTVSGAFDESDAGRVIDLLRQAGMSTL